MELEEYFGRFDCGTAHKANSPIIARISEIVELTTGIVVSAEIAPWCFGERRLATEQIDQVSALFDSVGGARQLYVFDRGYVSKELMRDLRDKGVDFIFRMPRSFHVKIDELFLKSDADTIVQLTPDTPIARVIVRTLPTTGELYVLITSLIDTELAPAQELFEIYWLRWKGCEEGYKLQKIGLELENFTGRGFEAVLQDFWAMVLIVNILQTHCLDEEGAWDISSPPLKRINKSVVFGSLHEASFLMIFGEMSIADLKENFNLLLDDFKLRYVRDEFIAGQM